MKDQSYTNHRRYVPGFHFVLLAFLVISFAASVFFLVRSFVHEIDRVSASISFLLSLSFLFIYFYARQFTVTVQDRAIRAEENLRHFVLTGKLLDTRLTMKQIVGLRFASDLEFAELSNRAVAENLSMDEIKKSIKTWRPDFNRA